MAKNPFVQSSQDHLSTIQGIYDRQFDRIRGTPPAAEGLPSLDQPQQQQSRQRQTGSLLAPDALRPMFEDAARKYNVPVNVLMAIAQQESSYNPNAVGQPTQWGRAMGIMQYIEPTAKALGINPFDPAQAIDAAARQFAERIAKGYTVEDAIMAHHGGDNRRQWGPKTQAYLDAVSGKARTIRGEYEPLLAQMQEREAADRRGQQATQNNFSADMDRDRYREEFMRNNPGAGVDDVQQAMQWYDQQIGAQQQQQQPADSGDAPERMGAWDTTKLLGQQLWDMAAYHLPASVAAALEGDDPYAERDWKDRLIDRSRSRTREGALPTDADRGTAIPGVSVQDMRSLGPSLGFSVAGMGAGLGVGLPAAAAGTVAAPGVGTAAGLAAGGAASGVTAYRMATNMFVRDLREMADIEAMKERGTKLSDEEFSERLKPLMEYVHEYGLWEAVPEAAANVIGFGVLKAGARTLIGKAFGNHVATRIATKAATVYGTELATETVTEQGQHNVEVKAGLSDKPMRNWTSAEDLGESFREIAPLTIMQTTLLAGSTKGAMMLHDRIKRAGLTPDQYDALMELNELVERGQFDPEGARLEAIRILDPNGTLLVPPGPIGRALQNTQPTPLPPAADGIVIPPAGGAAGRREEDDPLAPNADDILRRAQEATGPAGTVAEPASDIAAQVEAYQEGSRGPVFVDAGGNQPVPQGMAFVRSKFGGGYIAKPDDVQRIRDIEAATDNKEAAQAKILGYVQPKDEAIAGGNPVTIQTTDDAGNVVKEQLVDGNNPQAVAAATAAQAGLGDTTAVAPDQAIEDRLEKSKHDGKWFGSQEKADAYLKKNNIADTHGIKQDGQRFNIVPLTPKQQEMKARKAKQEPAAPVAPDAMTAGAAQPQQPDTSGLTGTQPRSMGEDGRPKDRQPINPGDTFRTASGRVTTPFPKQKSEKYASQWLIDNAVAEAEARGDDFNATVFRGEKPGKSGALPPASVASMQEYLFGQQPDVKPSVLKPLTGATQDAVQQERQAPAEEVAPAAQSKPASDIKAGQRITFNQDFDYVTGGAEYEVESVSKNGEVRLRNVKGGGKTSVTTSMLDAYAQRRGLTWEAQDQAPAAPDTAPEAADRPAGYGKNNTIFTEDAAAKARELLRKKLSQLNTGLDPEMVQAGITLAGYHIEAGARKFADYTKAMIGDLGEAARPYLRSWYEGVRYYPGFDNSGMTPAAELDSTTQESDVSPKMAIANRFRDEFLAGRKFASITEARKLAAEVLGVDSIKPGTVQAKMVDEAIEAGVVMAAREIIARDGNALPVGTYTSLINLYEAQPNLGVRTSTSIAQQAYSTPAPLAYLASRLAGITDKTSVYEPTAGNGMLLIAATPDNVVANELNADRAAMLRDILPDANVQQRDATAWNPPKKSDVIIANPPFGTVKDEAGNTVVFEAPSTLMPDGTYQTREIDHAIALKSLENMKDDGAAVLIIGGIDSTDQKVRSDKYNAGGKRTFFFNLYQQYNVVDHFTVAGDLYSKQGAQWPVDVIVIRGRGKSARKLPAVDVPRVYDSWVNLAEVLNDEYIDRLGAKQPERGGRDGAAGSQNDAAAPQGAADQPAGGATGAAGGTGRTGGAVSGGRANEQRADSGGNRGDGSGPRATRAGTGNTGSPVAKTGEGQPEGQGVSGTRTQGQESGRTDGEVDGGSNRPAAQRRVEKASEGQAQYVPVSKQGNIGTLVPANMRDAVKAALESLQDRVGDLDSFVARELGYKTSELGKFFSAEQIDALALAIENLRNGKGFIIADQTGVGKGRINAGIIRWALRNGKTPIFVTEKPNLYRDMLRDLADIGEGKDMRDVAAKVLMTNADADIPIDQQAMEWYEAAEAADAEGLPKPPKPKDGFLDKASPAKQKERLVEMTRNGRLSDGFEVVFTTYSQMQPVAGSRTARHDFLDAMIDGGILILDESHNAGGQGAAADPNKFSRAGYIRDLAHKAEGVFYSSATYAKRPDVMDLYFRTDLTLAVPDIAQLGETIERGGVPMQQVVASMLTEAGQLLRRERSFDGVEYSTPRVPVDAKAADDTSGLMRSILDFSDIVRGATEVIGETVKAEAAQASLDGSTGTAGAESTNFTSVMHNLISQYLLSAKVDATVETALAALKAGEKPVITVANTMESLINEYAEAVGVNVGDPIDMTFRTLFRRYLEKTREITIKDAFGRKTKHRLTDDELGPAGVAAYEKALRDIENAAIESLAASPIDAIKARLEAEGYKVGEITGRHGRIEYRGKTPTYAMRGDKERSIAGRIKTIEQFNNGLIDVVILNRAGSTGLSLHASPKTGKDVRRRHMIIAQAEANIDTHMQMLGRVHRTGQVVAPRYSQLVADIPAEMRPAAVLAKKMASLNANTSAARSSVLTAKDTPDFMNQYGDEVVAEMMFADQDTHKALGRPLSFNKKGDGFEVEGAARRVTGRIPLLPIKEQQAFYDMLDQNYREFVAMQEAMGENKLEAKTLPLDAKMVEETTLTEDVADNPSPFARGSKAVIYDVKRLGKPMTQEEIKSAVDSFYDGQAPRAKMTTIFDGVKARFDKFLADELASIEDDTKHAATEKRLRFQFDKLKDVLGKYYPGRSVSIRTPNGLLIYGQILRVEQKGNAKNPAATGTWKMTIALADASRQITLPLSQIALSDKESGRYTLNGENVDQVRDAFQRSESMTRETRVILEGNLLAAYSAFPAGQITYFEGADGSLKQGVLMPRNFDLKKAMAKRAEVLRSPADAAAAIKKDLYDSALTNEAGTLTINWSSRWGAFEITVPAAKAKGGRYHQNAGLLRVVDDGEFVKSGSKMKAVVQESKLTDALQAIYAMPEQLRMVKKSLMSSRADTPNYGSTPAALRDSLIKAFGRGKIDALERMGRLKIVETEADVPGVASPVVTASGAPNTPAQAFYDRNTGTMYLVAEGLSAKDAPGVLLHEAWHDAWESMTPKQRDMIVRGLKKAVQEGKYWARNASVRAEMAGERLDNWNEIAAYAIEERRNEARGIPGKIIKAIQDFIAKIRVALLRRGWKMQNITDAELELIAIQALRNIAEGGGGRGPRGGLSASRDAAHVVVDGVKRPAMNSEGRPIHPTQEGLRNFWRWFGNSRVVDDQGRPLVVYHGTRADIHAFAGEKVKGRFPNSEGFYFTSRPGHASVYADSIDNAVNDFNPSSQFAKPVAEGGNVMPVYVSVQNPKIITVSEWGTLESAVDGDGGARVRAARDSGHDGVIVKRRAGDEYDGDLVIAFRPEQIKSATGNRGTFDGANPSIIASRRPSGEPVPPKETIPRRLQRGLQDAFNRFTVVQNWLKEQGVDINVQNDVYQAEIRSHGRIAARVENFREQRIAGLIDRTQAAGLTMEQMSDWLLAEHAEEANAQIRKYAGNDVDTAFGMEDADAQAILSGQPVQYNGRTVHFPDANVRREAEALASEWRQIAEDAKQMRIAAGILTPEMVKPWEEVYQRYVPVKGGANEPAALRSGTGEGLSVKHKQKRRFGHDARDEMVIENLLRDYEAAIHQIEKNRVGMHLIQLLLDAQNPEVGTIGKPEKRKTLKPGQTGYALLDESGGLIASFLSEQDARAFATASGITSPNIATTKGDPRIAWAASPLLADNEVQVFVNGHAIRIQLNDPLLASQYKRMGVDNLTGVIALSRDLNRWFSKAYTSLAPEFILRNVPRDFTTGIVNLTGQHGAGMALRVMKNYPKAFGHLLKFAHTGNASRYVEQYRMAGGSTGAGWMSDLERIGTDVSHAYDRYRGVLETYRQSGAKRAVKAAFNNLIDKLTLWIKHMNAAGENAFRLAAYHAVLQKTGNEAEAVRMAKLATTNFNKRGEWASLSALYLFFNPAVQSAAALAEAVFKGRHRAQAWGLLSAFPALAALSMLQWDEDEWEELSDFDKYNHMLIRTGKDTHIKIPMAYGIGFFWRLGIHGVEAARGLEPERLAMRLADSAFEHFGPAINPLVAGDDALYRPNAKLEGAVLALPTAAKISLQPLVNINNFGKPIRPDSRFDPNQPMNQRMWRNTKGSFYDRTTSALNEMTGGTETQSGLIDISPEDVKFWWGTMTGGAGRFWLDSASLFSNLLSGQLDVRDVERREVPMARVFMGEARLEGTRAEFNTEKRRMQQLEANFRRAKNAHDDAGLAKFSDQQIDELFVLREFNRATRQATLIRDEIEAIMLDESLTISQKRQKIRPLEREEQAIYRDALRSLQLQ